MVTYLVIDHVPGVLYNQGTNKSNNPLEIPPRPTSLEYRITSSSLHLNLYSSVHFSLVLTTLLSYPLSTGVVRHLKTLLENLLRWCPTPPLLTPSCKAQDIFQCLYSLYWCSSNRTGVVCPPLSRDKPSLSPLYKPPFGLGRTFRKEEGEMEGTRFKPLPVYWRRPYPSPPRLRESRNASSVYSVIWLSLP